MIVTIDLLIIKRHDDMMTLGEQGEFNDGHVCIEGVTHTR